MRQTYKTLSPSFFLVWSIEITGHLLMLSLATVPFIWLFGSHDTQTIYYLIALNLVSIWLFLSVYCWVKTHRIFRFYAIKLSLVEVTYINIMMFLLAPIMSMVLAWGPHGFISAISWEDEE